MWCAGAESEQGAMLFAALDRVDGTLHFIELGAGELCQVADGVSAARFRASQAA